MNEEVKIERQLDVFKYTPDEIYDYIYDLKQENHQLKELDIFEALHKVSLICKQKNNVTLRYRFTETSLYIEPVEYIFTYGISLTKEKANLIKIISLFPKTLENYITNQKLVKR